MPERKDRQVERKVIVSALLLAVHLGLPSGAASVMAASAGSGWHTHLLGQLAHAGIFHLAANLYVLWLLRFTWKELATAYLISIPATFASFAGAAGFSLVIYALMGMKLPKVRMPVCGRVLFLSANAATAFIPSIAFGVHAAAFAMGFLYTKIKMLADDYGRACQGK